MVDNITLQHFSKMSELSELSEFGEFNQDIQKRLNLFTLYLERTKMDHKPYQYEGVKWILTNELRSNPPCGVRGGFIADEMGLGKTILMIGTMLCNYVAHTLIVVPPILIDQWYIQIFKTTGHRALIYHGDNKKSIKEEDLNRAAIVITTYGAITAQRKKNGEEKKQVISLLHKIKWSRVIFDEAHHLRNSNTTRYMGAKMLKAKIRWLVSGTPVQNSKNDFYSLCSMIKLPASYYTESENLREFACSFILKRTKKQVGILMTDVVLNKVIVGWSNSKEKEMAEEIHSALAFSRVPPTDDSSILNSLKTTGKLSLLIRARQCCILPNLLKSAITKQAGLYLKEGLNSSSKLDSVVASILERKGNGCGKLIFCHFREEIDEISKRLKAGGITRVATFDGRISNSKRHGILNDGYEALILQIQTGCEGLNLQENYSEIYFVSPHWNPSVEDQAIARCHRIGQTKPVFVKRFEMEEFIQEDAEIETRTVDKYVEDIQERKRMIANDCI
jgi:SNF2 family DNA or RNA helicase